MNGGNHSSNGIMYNDEIDLNFVPNNKNNAVYLDYFDELYEFEDGETEKRGNTVIRDEDPTQEVIDNTETL